MSNFIHIPKNGGTSVKSKCNDVIIYNGHDSDPKTLKNRVVIIRNPFDRFASAVAYSIKEGIKNEDENILTLVYEDFVDPSKWAEIIFGNEKDHPMYDNIMQEVLNKSHIIGKYKPKFKWTYTEQSRWFYNPTKVILFDNMNEEFKNSFGIELPYENESNKGRVVYSKEAKTLLLRHYKKDFKLYFKMKSSLATIY
jgi:hypothetical protein